MNDEKPVYNLKTLHAVFAASSLLLAAATVWVIVSDHRRPWKHYQGTYRDRVEPWMARARLHQHLLQRGERPDATGTAGRGATGNDAETERLRRAVARHRPSATRRWLRLPLIDALGRTLQVEQTWLPELTLDYHFDEGPRLDRCITCHHGIDQGWGGFVPASLLDPPHAVTLRLVPPGEPQDGENGPADTASPLRSVYGLELAAEDCLGRRRATVAAVLPESPAAEARLKIGDVIARLGDSPVHTPADAERYLSPQRTSPGEPVAVEVQRGMPQPYTAHPRRDLFVGPNSPHPVNRFGCTICHDGQGSATDFTWASHAPNKIGQAGQWRADYGWRHNPQWKHPMLPMRLVEARCLRCHHDVVALQPGDRFPEPSAPKLTAGYETVRRFGCFGCHTIGGYDAQGRRVGPDMRLEPPYAEAAETLLAAADLNDRQRALARTVVARAGDDRARRELVDRLRSRPPVSENPLVEVRRLMELLADSPAHPGTLRKVGPSLRHIAEKVGPDYLADRLRDPRHFHPESRMPRLFGLHEHLAPDRRRLAERLEGVEIRGIVAYLTAVSTPADGAAGEAKMNRPAGDGLTNAAPASVERGQRFLERRGCLACHKHAAFPGADGTEGADLTHI
ncbi:MAG: PDZ domain-containing protein, partial [Pirellulales bacterium]